ncbi:MAG TPA: hypothetical protein VHP55_13355, partial [Usitatibacter sp.]|nr:hypothetical protein [Usitatibacter sp.]
MRVRRVAASTVTLEISESGLATVGMAILLGSRGAAHPGRYGAAQQFHSRKRDSPCQGEFGALQQQFVTAPQQPPKI